MEQFSGNETKVYSIIPKGKEETLFEKFIDENKYKYKNELKEILRRLKIIGNTTGARSSFFKQEEGKYGDFVCALFDMPDKNLRLYCIRFGMDVIILGGGGEKLEGIRAWQDDEKLSEEANLMIDYADDILRRIDKEDIYWSEDRKELLGNLKKYDNDEDY